MPPASAHFALMPVPAPPPMIGLPAVTWVRSEATAPIDASGVLPDGSRFNGPAELRQALLSDPARFATTLTTKLMTYALGRGLEYYDRPAMRTVIPPCAAGLFAAPSKASLPWPGVLAFRSSSASSPRR